MMGWVLESVTVRRPAARLLTLPPGPGIRRLHAMPLAQLAKAVATNSQSCGCIGIRVIHPRCPHYFLFADDPLPFAVTGHSVPPPSASIPRLLRRLTGLKTGTRRLGIFTFSPVRGLRPVLGARTTVSKVPNPRSSIRWPATSASVSVRNRASTAAAASRGLMPVAWAIRAARSALVKEIPCQDSRPDELTGSAGTTQLVRTT